MSTPRNAMRGLAAALALSALAACADTPTVAPPEPLVPGAPALNETPPPSSSIYLGEQELEEIAAEVPGYAGHWYDLEGNRVIALTDLSKQSLALQVIGGRPQPELTQGETRTGQTLFVQAQYDFVTLRNWRNAASDPVLGASGALALDLDEVRNRLTVWIASTAAQAGVQSALTSAGVPLAAAIIEASSGVVAHQTLQNFFRPLRGGFQIQNAAGMTCSLGPPVPGGPAPAYFTASHCTAVFWANTGTNFFQHIVGGGNLIGPEINDPPGWACGGGWICRRSDVARVGINAAVPAANQIARTTGFAVGWAAGSINTVGVVPFNVINPPQAAPFVGQWVDKVGRTTGWNRGNVTNTCVTVNAPPPAPPMRRVMCQSLATYMSAGGDSGAPVFLWLAGGANARVAGVNWGAIGTTMGPRAVFSPSGNIAMDGV